MFFSDLDINDVDSQDEEILVGPELKENHAAPLIQSEFEARVSNYL